MFNFTSRTDQFGYTQATIDFNGVFYYFDFCPTENRFVFVSDAWLNADKPKIAQLVCSSQYQISYKAL